MSSLGMSVEMYKYIVRNKHLLKNIDSKSGSVTTINGSNGTVCSSTGYLRVRVGEKTLQVHQILAVELFGEECVGLQVNHIDGDKLNNSRGNLEVVTQRRNKEHQSEIGRNLGGVSTRKLSEEDVKYIRKNHESNKRKTVNNTRHLANMFNVSESTVRRLIRGETYRDA